MRPISFKSKGHVFKATFVSHDDKCTFGPGCAVVIEETSSLEMVERGDLFVIVAWTENNQRGRTYRVTMILLPTAAGTGFRLIYREPRIAPGTTPRNPIGSFWPGE